jgi:putative tricarboxylic transport membrane protein
MGLKDLIGGGIFTALGIFIFILTLRFPSLDDANHPGPGLFPTILAVLFVFFGGIVLYRGLKPAKETGIEDGAGEDFPGQNYYNPLFVLLLIIAYMLLSNWLGFLITSFFVLLLMMIKLRVSLWKSAVIAVLMTLFVNLMFSKILRVPLPPGFLRW